MDGARSVKGSARVSRAGFDVTPKQSFLWDRVCKAELELNGEVCDRNGPRHHIRHGESALWRTRRMRYLGRCYVGKIDRDENALHACAFELSWRIATSQERDADNPVCALAVAGTIACITSAP